MEPDHLAESGDSDGKGRGSEGRLWDGMLRGDKGGEISLLGRVRGRVRGD